MSHINLIVVKNSVVYENFYLPYIQAEKLFIKKCKQFDPAWTTYNYNAIDIDAILDNGYYEFSDGSICLSWPIITV